MLIRPLISVNNGSKYKDNRHKAVSFTAQKLPSGKYSNWFFEEIKSKIELDEQAFTVWMTEKLNELRIKLIQKDITKYKIENCLSARKSDFLSLRDDIIKGKHLLKEDLGLKKYDEPIGEYTSKNDRKQIVYGGSEPYVPPPPPPPAPPPPPKTFCSQVRESIEILDWAHFFDWP